jgi:hypothetical protein
MAIIFLLTATNGVQSSIYVVYLKGIGLTGTSIGTLFAAIEITSGLGSLFAGRAMRLGGRVEMWRGGCRPNISVAAPFVWRCLTGSTVAPFPHPAHRTGRADFPHPALGQDVTPSPTARCTRAQSGVRDRNARRGARVDKSRPCVA